MKKIKSLKKIFFLNYITKLNLTIIKDQNKLK